MLRPLHLHTVAQIRALERHWIEVVGIPSFELMTRAGVRAARQLHAHWSAARDILVLAGSGNNAGDGYVLAREARALGLSPRVIALTPPEMLRDDAARAARECLAAGVTVESLDWRCFADQLAQADVVVDAIFGIGLQRDVTGDIGQVVSLVNASARPVLAIDVPSGLCADTGKPRACAIRANLTVTFIGHKLGLNLVESAPWVGRLVLETLVDEPTQWASAVESVGFVAQRLDEASLRQALPRRSMTAHKGDSGHVIVVGGGLGMPGAARLAAIAALRVGAGKVTVLCHPSSAASIATAHPELMVRPVADAAAMTEHLQGADVRVLGPGLGRDDWSRRILEAVLDESVPTVLDADALTLLSEIGVTEAAAEARVSLRPWVLTPHPGEAAKLLGIAAKDVQADRPAALDMLVARCRSVIVLKGAGTWIGCADRRPTLCAQGNPRLAIAGTGDVLAGILAGIWAQQRDRGSIDSAFLSAQAAVWLHLRAAELPSEEAHRPDRGLLAGELAMDLFRYLP
ncbi:MAG: NAD(P)H-hydrate dehydratase [Steroidobacteraceae bacterium]